MPALSRTLTRHLAGRLARADARYRQRADLARLDSRMLSDIGISQADVAAELRGRPSEPAR